MIPSHADFCCCCCCFFLSAVSHQPIRPAAKPPRPGPEPHARFRLRRFRTADAGGAAGGGHPGPAQGRRDGQAADVVGSVVPVSCSWSRFNSLISVSTKKKKKERKREGKKTKRCIHLVIPASGRRMQKDWRVPHILGALCGIWGGRCGCWFC